MHFQLDQSTPIATPEELPNYDAIAVGAPTRFGRIPSAMGSFWERAGALWMSGALHGKVGGAFASSATQHGGNETTLFSIIANLMHFGMIIVGLPYSHASQMTLDEIVGGAPYGATTIAGGQHRWAGLGLVSLLLAVVRGTLVGASFAFFSNAEGRTRSVASAIREVRPGDGAIRAGDEASQGPTEAGGTACL
jgi:hypothetical protein